MQTSVAGHANALGYLNLGFASFTRITARQVEGVAGSFSTVHACYAGGSPCYPLQHRLQMAMLKYGVNPNRVASYARATDSIDQILSPAGQTLVNNLGLVPLLDTVRIPDADVDMDGVVDASDLALIGLSGTWATANSQHWIRADVNRDGAVDISDLALIGTASNWSRTWSRPQK